MIFNKIILSTILISIWAGSSLLAQKTTAFDPTNAREGEKVEYCHQHIKMAELMKNPEFAAMYEQDKIAFQKAKTKRFLKELFIRFR